MHDVCSRATKLPLRFFSKLASRCSVEVGQDAGVRTSRAAPEVLALARFRDETKAPVVATARLKAAFNEAEGDLFVDLLRISLKLIDAKVRDAQAGRR